MAEVVRAVAATVVGVRGAEAMAAARVATAVAATAVAGTQGIARLGRS